MSIYHFKSFGKEKKALQSFSGKFMSGLANISIIYDYNDRNRILFFYCPLYFFSLWVTIGTTCDTVLQGDVYGCYRSSQES